MHPVYKHKGFALYLCTVEEQALVQNDPWVVPADPGPYFWPSAAAMTNCAIEVESNAFDF